jgi:hypothetical protein
MKLKFSAFLTILSLFAAPCALDYCLIACESHVSTDAAASCHHDTSSSARMADGRGSCGHDHGDEVTAVAAASKQTPNRSTACARHDGAPRALIALSSGGEAYPALSLHQPQTPAGSLAVPLRI